MYAKMFIPQTNCEDVGTFVFSKLKKNNYSDSTYSSGSSGAIKEINKKI
jgi:hypothetical protein